MRMEVTMTDGMEVPPNRVACGFLVQLRGPSRSSAAAGGPQRTARKLDRPPRRRALRTT